MVLVVAVPLVLLLLPARFTAPLRTVFIDGFGTVTGAAFQAAGNAAAAGGTLTDMFMAQERRRARNARMQKLRNELKAARARIERQKRQLRNIAGLEISAERYSLVSAGVTAYDASALRAGITIGVGRSDGVESGQAVTAMGALVGKVARVGRWHSTVRLLTDPRSAVAARVNRTRRLCVLEGGGTETLALRWVGCQSEIKRGDILVTACLSELKEEPCRIPEGVPVATVQEVDGLAQFPLFRSVKAVPQVNVSRLEWVQVLVPRPGN